MTAKEEFKAARKLRADVIKQLGAGGQQTNAEVAAALEADATLVRNCIGRLVKGGLARSIRSKGARGEPVAHYQLSDSDEPVRNVAKPHRPVLKKWSAHSRDPLALPPQFFGRIAA